MVVSWQSPLGEGTSKKDELQDLSLNFKGSTYASRFLSTVCVKKVYRKHPQRFDKIMAALADELCELFTNGVEVVITKRCVRVYGALISFKGDWPIHARVGNLKRHFGRKGVYQATAKSGICHLCRAGEINYPPFDFSINAAWKASYLQRVPWDVEPALARVPQTAAKEALHKFDVFHTLHKGCFAELAGSGIVLRHSILRSTSFPFCIYAVTPKKF